tara:strand:- start:17 stop:1411 length:1395 start_codon:yes stop_codon:yes gene_type:complete
MINEKIFIYLFCLVFVVFKIISIYLTKLDLFGDEAQYWIWSKNLDFGYYSKPPLLAWVIAFVSSLFGSSLFVLKAIPIFVYCITSLVVYFISKKLTENKDLAIITAVSFFVMPGVSFSSFLLSTDVLFILFWSLSLLIVLRIKDAPSITNFLLLGIFVGLAFMSKYAAIYFVVSFVFLFFEKTMRRLLLDNWIKLFCCCFVIVVILSPNIIWNLNNNWITLDHTSENAALDRASFNLFESSKFLLSQIVMIGPLVFLSFVFWGLRVFRLDFNTKFLIIFSLPTFLIVLAESMLVRANANWAAASLMGGLILFVHAVYKCRKKILYYNLILNFIMGFALFYFIAIGSSYGPFTRISGISSFGDEIYNKVGDNKNIVVGERMLFSNLNYIFRERQIKMFVPYLPNSEIKNHFQITNALPQNFKNNFIFLGYEEQIKYLREKHKIYFLKEYSVVFQNEPIKVYEVVF